MHTAGSLGSTHSLYPRRHVELGTARLWLCQLYLWCKWLASSLYTAHIAVTSKDIVCGIRHHDDLPFHSNLLPFW